MRAGIVVMEAMAGQHRIGRLLAFNQTMEPVQFRKNAFVERFRPNVLGQDAPCVCFHFKETGMVDCVAGDCCHDFANIVLTGL